MRKNIENFLIFQPTRLRARKIQKGLLKKLAPQRFFTPDGIKLYAWFIKPKGEMPVILHLHGQAESISNHQDIAKFCLKNGIGAFMLSYRGHYKSGGNASEKGLYDDAKAAMAQLKKLGVDEDKIILWGHSLGTAIAVETAINSNVAGVILQSAIKDTKTAAIDVYKFYCARLKVNILSNVIENHINSIDIIQKMDNINKVHKIKCPLLILHSKTDKIAPFQNSIELAEKNENTQLYISENGSHWDTQWCLEKSLDFIQSVNS